MAPAAMSCATTGADSLGVAWKPGQAAVVGTSEQVTPQLVDLVTTLPVDPLLVRPQWPTMDTDETIAAINRLGKEVVPAMRAIEPRTTIDEALLDPALHQEHPGT